MKQSYIYLTVLILLSCSNRNEKAIQYQITQKVNRDTAIVDEAQKIKSFIETCQIKDSIYADANNDGNNDTIFLYSHNERYFILSVNGINLYDSTFPDASVGKLHVIDFNKKDDHKEITVGIGQPNDDYSTIFYDFKNNKINHLGTIIGLKDTVGCVNGDNKVSVYHDGHKLCTFAYSVIYTMNDQHWVVQTHQDIYKISCPIIATVIKELKLQKSPTDTATSCILKPGTTATIIATDTLKWFFVKNDGNHQGWFSVNGYDQINGTKHTGREIFADLPRAN